MAESMLFATWLSRIPMVKEDLGLSDGQLGLMLFGMPLGLLLMNPFSGQLTARMGVANASRISLVFMALAFLVPTSATEKWLLFIGLMLAGMSSAFANVAMNAAATRIEQQYGMRIMSTCHGMWSLGGMTAALFASFLIASGVPTFQHMLGMSLLATAIAWLLGPDLSGIAPPEATEKSGFIMPDANLLLLICIGIFGMMAEGLAFDWAGVYLRQVVHTSQEVSALGLTCYAAAMTLARFTGDGIIPRLGEKRMLTIGGCVAVSGLLLAIVMPYKLTVLLGFALLGAGCALTAPILFGASMRLPGINPAAGLATYATFSFIGFLAGPPLIGFVAEALDLPMGLLMVALLLCVGLILIQRARY
jgi:predicted MFS family arabinose efflux permease